MNEYSAYFRFFSRIKQNCVWHGDLTGYYFTKTQKPDYAKKHLPFPQKYATLYPKHYFKSGMAISGAYLSNSKSFHDIKEIHAFILSTHYQ
ncbi:MAG: hypothetical protein HFH94_13240 [Lachnospiraceae bacterium]|nr:hypothetical protein [uncultured Acetatifactor sp.]MCI9220682.1 hypothetical protein [Lachnospiraceae bacterium]